MTRRALRRRALVLAVSAGLLGAAAGAARADAVHDALDRGRRTRRPVLVEFRADWCGPCRFFERQVLSDGGVKRALGDIVFVRIDVDTRSGHDAQNRLGIVFIPTFIAFDRAGKPSMRVEGIDRVFSPSRFIALVERVRTWSGDEMNGQTRRTLAAAVAQQARAARIYAGSRRANMPLARAVLSETTDPAEKADLFARHVASAEHARELVFATYLALQAKNVSGALAASQRAVELSPYHPAALAAAAHAALEAGDTLGANAFHERCVAAARLRTERFLCTTVADRADRGEDAPASRLIQLAVTMYTHDVLHPELADRPRRQHIELMAEMVAWNPAGVAELASVEAQTKVSARRAALPVPAISLAHRVAVALASVRLDGGAAQRVLAGGRALVPLLRGFDVQPAALVTAEAGVDGDGHAAYDAAAMVGFGVGPAGAILGLYAGIGVNDPGAHTAPSLTIPVELALSGAGKRFGLEGFVRTAWSGWSRSERDGGSLNAESGADELSLGLAARVPGPLARPLLVGVRYDEILDEHLFGVWLGTDLLRR